MIRKGYEFLGKHNLSRWITDFTPIDQAPQTYSNHFLIYQKSIIKKYEKFELVFITGDKPQFQTFGENTANMLGSKIRNIDVTIAVNRKNTDQWFRKRGRNYIF
ncbi:hypothetical protein PEDI_12130 [Persicobacter diffluens]|uniref:Uncharacterized protein n=1 Tax=Persicobacter diffluens TaxID=981 RepID=A0AAN4VX65_9BACT|nr:hypothetical protein PEDI_12130 [Persicobacter diffluens]